MQRIKEIIDLEAKKESLLARMEIIEQLQRSRPEIVHVFDQLVRTLPDGVHLTTVKQTGPKHRDQGRRRVQYPRFRLHAQHRQVRLAEGPGSGGG